jgi:vancomycin resistance protein YoaR
VAACAVVDGNESKRAGAASSDAGRFSTAGNQYGHNEMTTASPDIPDKSFGPGVPAPEVTTSPGAAEPALPNTQPLGITVEEQPGAASASDEGTEPPTAGRHLRADNGESDDDGGEVDARREAPLTPRHLRQAPPVPDEEKPSRLTPARLGLAVPVVLAALLGLIVVAWAVDNFIHTDQAHRNVQVAGHAVGGSSEDSLPAAIDQISDGVADREVQVILDGEALDQPVTAGALGLTVDTEAAVDEVMDIGRSGPILTRPFEWLGSFRNDRTVDLTYEVSETQAVSTLRDLYGRSVETNTVEPATNPHVVLSEGQFVMVEGHAGRGLNEARVPDELRAAADRSPSPYDPLVLHVDTTDIEPSIADGEAQNLADQLNTMTDTPLTLVADDERREIDPEQVRSWITPVVDPTDPATLDALGLDQESLEEGGEGEAAEAGAELDALEQLTWVFDEDAADAAVAELYSDLSAEPVNAEATMAGGQLQVTESQDGIDCCGEEVGRQVREAVENGEDTIELEVEVVEPEVTTEDFDNIRPIGGNRAWRDGSEVPGPRPGYTTYAVGEGGRAHNIGLMAEQVNGAFIGPGETWSINGHVGARQCPPYRDDAGAIRDNEIVEECGGGTSQFATTLLNAAYFAGLDVTGRAHSQYFPRYPAGREATMGAPGTGLDVTITNNSPGAIYIQAARHGDEVTATIWGQDFAVVEDLGNNESEQGECRVVTNTRRRTINGNTTTDQFTATYRPGEGETC